MATSHSGQATAPVKRLSRLAELRCRKAEHERQAELSRQRQELAQFLDAFEFDDAPGLDDARSLVALRVF
jgi:hypothetical protein